MKKILTYILTKKGVSLVFVLIFCVALTVACFFGMFNATNSTSYSNMNLSNLINLDSKDLPFEIEKKDTLYLTYNSFESDLSVTIKNQDDKIVIDYPFMVSLSLLDSDDEPNILTDSDEDGLVYFDNLEAGDYTLELIDTEDYNIPEPLTITIEPPVETKAIDVSEKVVSQDKVNLAEEDGQFNKHSDDKTEPPPVSKDTIEFVESRIETIESTEEVPLVDDNGKQIYQYIPALDGIENKYLTLINGNVTDLEAVLDKNGYLLYGKKEIEEDPFYEEVSLIDSSYNLLPYGEGTINAEQIAPTTIETTQTTTYYGWQTIDGKTYYFDKTGTKVTGFQTIQGTDYLFSDDGSISNLLGVDVSYWQGNINWSKVKDSGIDFVILRVGFMGWGSGALVEDSTFKKNLVGAKAAGLKVGAYFYDAAITKQEAVEEASMCIQMLGGQSLDYPIFIDMEDSGPNARNKDLTSQQKTLICQAFCNTIKNSGYRSGVYASSSYLTSELNMSLLRNNYVWVANWGVTNPYYTGHYDIWQYSQSGVVDGISGVVDMNISYMGN
ncbi:MAG TPA: GH25 family lysozyme [Anaerovoracaceae bacterium]|nr:GH25 family lysozyme [Anaerovoracaceae bacterium]